MPDDFNIDMQWFHVILTMYGNWLPGDERGFRTRKHRKHVEGDYEKPPSKGRYEELAAHSKDGLKYDPAQLSFEQRKIVGLAIRDRLHKLDAPLACIAISRTHGHVLVKLPPDETRQWIGKAKRHAWYELHNTGWNDKLWAKRPKFEPIDNRQYQMNVYRYILRHEREDAFIWKHSEGYE